VLVVATSLARRDVVVDEVFEADVMGVVVGFFELACAESRVSSNLHTIVAQFDSGTVALT